MKIILQNISKFFLSNNEKCVFLKINAIFEKGKTYSVIGSSGSGKSTLLQIIGNIETPSSGSIEYSNKKKPKFGYILQDHNLIKELTIKENLEISKLIQKNDYNSLELLNKVGLKDFANYFPWQLSGGQRQRAAIARGIGSNPDFLLADEPTGNLDQKTGSVIIDLLLKQATDLNIGVIISTHDPNIYNKTDFVINIEDFK